MPVRSTVVDHPHRISIDAQLRAGERPIKHIAEEFGIGYDSLWRYARKLTAVAPKEPVAAELDAASFFSAAVGKAPLPWQRQYLAEDRHLLLLKGRQIGASTSGAVIALRLCRANDGSTALIISPSQRQSGEILAKARHMALFRLGWDLRYDSASMLQLDNGSRIISLPGSDVSIRGYSPDIVIIDEAAFVVDATFSAARPMIAASGGRIICQSTPAGRVGWFYELATDVPGGWAFMQVRSEDAGTITPEFLAGERETMDPTLYAQEYEADFGMGGTGLFAVDDVRSLFEETGP